jgi:hypothetical protein
MISGWPRPQSLKGTGHGTRDLHGNTAELADEQQVGQRVHGVEAGEVEEREESRLAPAWGRRSREHVGEKRYEDGRGGGGSMNQRGKQGQ